MRLLFFCIFSLRFNKEVKKSTCDRTNKTNKSLTGSVQTAKVRLTGRHLKPSINEILQHRTCLTTLSLFPSPYLSLPPSFGFLFRVRSAVISPGMSVSSGKPCFRVWHSTLHRPRRRAAPAPPGGHPGLGCRSPTALASGGSSLQAPRRHTGHRPWS